MFDHLIFVAQKGDKIHCAGITVEIDKILYCDFIFHSWDIEFIDTNGKYRHWKQNQDKGYIIYKDNDRIKSLVSDGILFTDVMRNVYGTRAVVMGLDRQFIGNNKTACLVVIPVNRFIRLFYGKTMIQATENAVNFLKKSGFDF